MQKNTSVTLGEHYETFIAEQVAKGQYGTTSEAIRAGLRLLEEREKKMELLRRALIEGEESGLTDFSFDEIMNVLEAEDDDEGETKISPKAQNKKGQIITLPLREGRNCEAISGRGQRTGKK